MSARPGSGAYDAVGVGVGPFNLSLAALAEPVQDLRCRFFDGRSELQWHPGLLFPEATIQVSHLKDLVTLADPTSRYSFLAFLAAHRRMYRFVNARFPRISRREFNQYLGWVAHSLPNVSFDHWVHRVELDGDHFSVTAGASTLRARNVVLATGLIPRVPDCAREHLGPTLFHAVEYLHRSPSLKGRRVAVIGGGQTGAEVVHHLLSRADDRPRELVWISRRSNFHPIDDSPFAEELFTPGYSQWFFDQAPGDKARLIEEQRLASDGISTELLVAIYQRLYEVDYLDGEPLSYQLLPHRELSHLEPSVGGWRLSLEEVATGARPDLRPLPGEGPATDRTEGRAESRTEGPGAATVGADLVILATGFRYRLPQCLEPLRPRLSEHPEGLEVRKDFSLAWDGPPGLGIYVQNAARHVRGVADPNLSLMAWRSAVILNSLAGRTVYDVEDDGPLFAWARPPEAAPRVADVR